MYMYIYIYIHIYIYTYIYFIYIYIFIYLFNNILLTCLITIVWGGALSGGVSAKYEISKRVISRAGYFQQAHLPNLKFRNQ